MTVLGVMFALARLEQQFPYWTVLPAILLALAWRDARHEKEPALVWSWLAAGWIVASFHFCSQLRDGLFGVIGPNTAKPAELQEGIAITYISNLSLPILLTTLTLWSSRQVPTKRRAIVTTWLKACVVVVLVDIHALIIYMMMITILFDGIHLPLGI
jgi:hypothetical protein